MKTQRPLPFRPLSAAAAGTLAAALLAANPATSLRAQTVSTWNGGAGNWSDNTKWNNGVPNSATADARVDGGKTAVTSTVSIDGSYTVGRLTVDLGDSVSLNNGQTFTVTDSGGFTGSGSLVNNGAFTVGSTGSFTDLFFNGATTLSGSGTLTLQNAARIRGSGTLTNTSTIQGETFNSGSLGTNEIGLNNAAGGLIDANNSSGLALVVDPNSASGLTNAGTLRASNGGVLQLTGNGGGFTNTGAGTISALNNSQVQLRDGASVSGGTLSTAGTGTIHTSNSATLANLTNAGAFVADNGTKTTLTGTITNNGTFTVNSTGSFTDVLLNGNVTLAGSGTLNLQSADRIRGSGTLTNTSTIQGETSNSGSFGNNEIGIVNQRLINANVSGLALVVDPSLASGLTNNGGVLRASAGGILQLSGNGGGAFNNTGGTIEALNNAGGSGSEVQLVSGAAITGGTLNSTGNGLVRVTGGGSSLTTLTNAGTLLVNNGADLTLAGTITNNGTFTVNSTGSFTDVLLSGNVTLTGTGTLNLSQADRVRSASGTPTLTNAAGHTIQGETFNSGSIGTNEINVVNQGLIDANVSGKALVLDPAIGTGTFANTSTLRASNGGVLLLTGNGGGTFDNTGGVIRALAGSEVQLTAGATVSGGTLATTGSGVVRNLDTATLGTITNAGTFIANNGTTTFLAAGSTLTNNGTFTVNSTGSFTDVFLNGDVTLAGSGTLTLSQADRVRGSGTLTNTSTIQGETFNFGSLGTNEIGIVNAAGALINANVSGLALVVDPNSTLGLTNQGTMQASNGGVLQLTGNGGGTFTNTGAGVITALTGSEVQLTAGVSVSGGTLATVGSGVVRNVDNATLANLTNAGTFIANNGTNTTLAGTITNNGSVTINSTGSFTDVLLSGNVTLTGTGTLNLQNADRVRSAGGTTPTLTNAAGHTIQGETNNSGSLGTNEIAISNAGLINANISGLTLLIDPANVANAFVNTSTGTVRASNGGTANLSANGGGAFTNNGLFVASGNNSTLTVPAASLTNISGNTLTGGTYTASGASAATPATVDLNGAAITTNAATVKLIGPGASIPAINGIATNQGAFALDGNRTFTTVGAFSSPGTLAVGAGSTFTVNGAFSQAPSGTVAGAGTVAATGVAALNGTIAPGGFTLSDSAIGFSEFNAANHPAGSLTLQGPSVVFSSLTMLNLALSAPAGPSMVGVNNDHLFVNGNFTLDGTLNLTARAGFGPGTYDIIDYTGALTNNVLDIGSAPAGFTYRISTMIPGQVDLIVTAVPEPQTWAMIGGGLGLLFLSQRARRRVLPTQG